MTAKNPTERNQRVFEPDGKSGNVTFWDWKTGERLSGPVPLPSEPRGLAFRPNGRMLAVVCADYRVVLVDPRTGTITHNLDPGVRSRPGNANFWWSNGEARFSPDGRFLATWEMSSSVHVWNPDKGELLYTLAHNERQEGVFFNPVEPALMATGGRDSLVRIWDLRTGKLSVGLPHPGWAGGRMQFTRDGSELVTASGNMLFVWDTREGKLKEGIPHGAMDIHLTADQRWLVALTGEFQVTDWRTKTPAGPPWKTRGGLNLALVIPAGDRRVIVGGFSGTLVGYDLETMVRPTAAPAEDLVQFAEVVAGRRILSQGRVVPLSSAEWAERWQRLQRDGSPLLPGSPGAQ